MEFRGMQRRVEDPEIKEEVKKEPAPQPEPVEEPEHALVVKLAGSGRPTSGR